MTVLEPVIAYLITLKLGVKVTLEQIMLGADRPRKPVLRVLDRLVREGKMVEIEDNKIPAKYGEYGRARRNPTWKMISYPIYTNPRSPKRRTLRDRMWKAMRDKKTFTRKELMLITGCAEGSIGDYTKLLEHHGILRVVRQYRNEKWYVFSMKNPPVKRPVVEEFQNLKNTGEKQDAQ